MPRTKRQPRSSTQTRSIPDIFRSGSTRSAAEVDAVNAFADAAEAQWGEDITSAVAWAEIEQEAREAGIAPDGIYAWLEARHEAFRQTPMWAKHEKAYQRYLARLAEREREAQACGCTDCAAYLRHAAQGEVQRRAWEAGYCRCPECVAEREAFRAQIAAADVDADTLLAMTAEACMAAADRDCTCEVDCGCQDPSCTCESCGECLHAHGIGDTGERCGPTA